MTIKELYEMACAQGAENKKVAVMLSDDCVPRENPRGCACELVDEGVYSDFTVDFEDSYNHNDVHGDCVYLFAAPL